MYVYIYAYLIREGNRRQCFSVPLYILYIYYICMHIYIYRYICAYIYVDMYKYIYIYICLCM